MVSTSTLSILASTSSMMKIEGEEHEFNDEGEEHLPPRLLHLPLLHQPTYRSLSQIFVLVKNLLKLSGKLALKRSGPVRSQS